MLNKVFVVDFVDLLVRVYQKFVNRLQVVWGKTLYSEVYHTQIQPRLFSVVTPLFSISVRVLNEQ
jgi:hypothetical protein